MNFIKNFPLGQDQSTKNTKNYKLSVPNVMPSQQRNSDWLNDASEVS